MSDAARVTDHVQIGSPGTPAVDAGVCDACGIVIERVAQRFGNPLTLLVEEAQQHAGGHEISLPTQTPRRERPRKRPAPNQPEQ